MLSTAAFIMMMVIIWTPVYVVIHLNLGMLSKIWMVQIGMKDHVAKKHARKFNDIVINQLGGRNSDGESFVSFLTYIAGVCVIILNTCFWSGMTDEPYYWPSVLFTKATLSLPGSEQILFLVLLYVVSVIIGKKVYPQITRINEKLQKLEKL